MPEPTLRWPVSGWLRHPMRALHLRVLLWILAGDGAPTTVPEVAAGIDRSREPTRRALVELQASGFVRLHGYAQGNRHGFVCELELNPRRWRALPRWVSRETDAKTVGS